jgi:hypothetical protein
MSNLRNTIYKRDDHLLDAHDTHPSYVSAFTVLEMLMVLILTSIIILSGITGYLNYTRLLQQKNDRMNCGKETMLFYQTISHEFTESCWARVTDNSIELKLPEQEKIFYSFEEKYVLRYANDLVDTFFVQVTDLKSSKDEVTGYDNAVNMEVKNCNETYPVSLIKEYSNEMKMNKLCQ